MSQFIDGPTKTFTAGAAIGVNLRVKLSAGKLAAAGATDVSIGTLLAESFADLDIRAVRLRTAAGTTKMVASEAITAGNPVYAAASGKIAATGDVYEGIALEAAANNGDTIEVLPLPNVDVAQTIDGTNAATFTVDADATTAKVALATGVGTGDFTATIVAPTLAANRTITLPAVTSTLATLAGTETLTNKTLTAPVITSPATGQAGPSSTFATFIPLAAQQALTGSGAVNLTSFYTTLNTTGGGAYTLADGVVKGQLKKVQLLVDAGDAVLTPTNLAGGSTITFADIGDYALLAFDGTDWVAIELGNDADGVTAPVLA